MLNSHKKYPLGALKNPKDKRNIKLTQVQPAKDYPAKNWVETDFIPVLNQKQLGACVGHTDAFELMYQNFKETNIVVKLSARFPYAMAKKVDGIPNSQGTFPIVTTKIIKDVGCATENTVPNDTDLSHDEYINVELTDAIKEDAYPFRSKGYAEVGTSESALKNALAQNGVIKMTISVGNYTNPIKKGSDGLHRVALVGYGYSGLKVKDGKVVPYGTKKNRFFFRNSWGKDWGVNGYGWFDLDKQELQDGQVDIDVPNELLDLAKKAPKMVVTRETSNDKQTLGSFVATYNGKTFTGKTLELPDLNNKINVSRINAGQYVCKKEKFKGKYDAYHVMNVSKRSGIFIHIGNYFSDILGCILLGKTHTDINKDGYKDVTSSKDTLTALIKFFDGKDFTLIIK